MEESHPSPCATNTAYTGDSYRHHRFSFPRHEEHSDESEPPKPVKMACIEDLVEMVRKGIHEDTSQPRGGPGRSILRIFDYPLSEEITSHWFPKKFVIPNFDCCTGVTDPVKHLRVYQVKMTVHSHDDLLMCLVFSSSLKGVALD